MVFCWTKKGTCEIIDFNHCFEMYMFVVLRMGKHTALKNETQFALFCSRHFNVQSQYSGKLARSGCNPSLRKFSFFQIFL